MRHMLELADEPGISVRSTDSCICLQDGTYLELRLIGELPVNVHLAARMGNRDAIHGAIQISCI